MRDCKVSLIATSINGESYIARARTHTHTHTHTAKCELAKYTHTHTRMRSSIVGAINYRKKNMHSST
jgi:hypothetical protein